jgi:hypothetical protein
MDLGVVACRSFGGSASSFASMMYGGKTVSKGDTIYIFASENEGGQGLIARGVVTSAERQATDKIVGISQEAAAFLRRFC